jgi:3-keto-disaccharide hydrolase
MLEIALVVAASIGVAADDGFVPLFDGKSLAGWVNVNGAPSTWTVGKDETGAPIIVCTGKPTGVLRTDRMFENFVLDAEWRHLDAQGNSGIFVWSDALPVRGQPFTRAVEVQVMLGSEGDWFTSDGDVFPIQGATMKPENGRKDGQRAFPTEKRMKPAGQWNHYVVTCVDGSISLEVNGKVVTRGHDAKPRRGYLCLESEGSPIQFRNLRVKELPPAAPPLAPDLVAAADEGFASLYDGVDFAGWKFGKEHEGHFVAKDWTIDYDGGGADLWTEKEYRDFVLVADWRWTEKGAPTDRPLILPSGESPNGPDGKPQTKSVVDAGDSGIYLRGSSKSQVNIWCWPCGSGEVYGYRTDAAQPPDVRAGVTPRVAADAPIGEWNRFVITMKGDRLTVDLNGRRVLDGARLPGVAPSGPIALQKHDGKLQFANLYIRDLP